MKVYKILAITIAIGGLGMFTGLNTQIATATGVEYNINIIENENSDDDEITFELRDKAEKMFRNDPKKSNLKTTETNYGNGLIIKDKNLQWNGELDLSNQPKKLVLHHIEASRPNSNIPVEDVHSWHLANGWSGIGYHFYINKNGEIFRGRPENAIGAHAKGFNTGSLGVAVEGRYGSETMNSVQKQAVIKLSKYLREKYDIDDIKGHGELMPTDCPGKNYPLDEIRNEVKSYPIVEGDIITWKNINNQWYYINTWTGEKLTGWQFVNNKWYYMDTVGEMKTGWQLINDKWYFLENHGGMINIGWQFINDKWYYFDNSGAMQTGWQLINNKWYFLESHGGMINVGWQFINDKWYYFDNSGAMQTGWQFINNKWYFLENHGGMINIGWQFINDKWYYFDNSGAMQTGWLNLNGEWYYLVSSGEMKVNWEFIDNHWYYFNEDGKMQKGWQNISGSFYYLYENGTMAANTTIEGIEIGANGVANK